MDKACTRQQRANLGHEQNVTWSLFDKQFAGLEIANHRLQQLQQILLQYAPKIRVGEVAGQPYATASTRIHLELLLPHAQLRAYVEIEEVRFLSGADARVR